MSFATAALVSGAQAAPPPPSPNPLALIEVAPPDDYPNNSPHILLARVDPVTLRPRSPTLDLGRMWPNGYGLARSPDGRRAVVRANPAFVVDLQSMRRITDLPTGGDHFAWVSRRRLVVASDHAHSVKVVDPVASVVRQAYEFRAEEWFGTTRIRGGFAAVVGSLAAPLRVVEITAGRIRVRTLRSMWLGLESGRAGDPDVLPPSARAALDWVRAEVARSENVPVSAVKSLAVTPANFPTTAMGCPRFAGQPAVRPGYQIIVQAAGRRHDYRAGLTGGGAKFCRHGSTPSTRNLLRAGRGVHHVRGAALAADPRSRRAFVVTPEGMIADVSFARESLRLRKVAPLPQFRTEELEDTAVARWAGDAQLVYWLYLSYGTNPIGVRIDLRTGRVYPLVERGCRVDVRVGLTLIYGRGCRGLDARSPLGRRRFRLFIHDRPVKEVDRAGRYAYVRLDDGARPDAPRKTLHVVDLWRGAVVGQLDVRASTRVISE